ncbi:hypothetical protein N7478_003414 [Penicillium angulare]|uniref:uncharacterized protein n=1 Tax=Penicillium angulare TaxID=116970 RepID=UPI0025418B3F|nr:uncharacterized protein N7478_003414 [Penicillium angulare]KAJ5287728.1 hypothetical protein N7478_003414 [Penicillium angulare]
MSATLADPYRGFVATYSHAGKPDDHHDLINYDAAHSQPREKLLSGLSYHSEGANTSSFGTHLQAVLPPPEPQTNGHHQEQPSRFAPVHHLLHPPHYSYDIPFPSDTRKRSRSGSEGEANPDMERNMALPPPVHPMSMDGSVSAPEYEMMYPIPSDHSVSHPPPNPSFASPLPLSLPLPIPQHHHHRLPPQSGLLSSIPGHGSSSPPLGLGPPSVVGQLGMPEPAPRPKGPKLKFTPEEDALLVELKEEKNLTWKQIADFFPGRTSGTLQVRYCTKLKAKDVIWTDDMLHRLNRAMDEYENDRWRIVAGKVGNGFTPAACRERVTNFSG